MRGILGIRRRKAKGMKAVIANTHLRSAYDDLYRGSGRGTLATSSAVLPRVVIEPRASANVSRVTEAIHSALSSFRK